MNAKQPDLVFTRYLYVKNQAILSLVLSLLKREEECIFWAFELYHSGYKKELLDLIVKIYYDFYAVLHPTFEKILFQKIDVCVSLFDNPNETLERAEIYNLLKNLMNRSSSVDVFMLKILTIKQTKYKIVDASKDTSKDAWREMLSEQCDFFEISKKVVSISLKNLNTELEIILDCFCDLLPDLYKESDKKIDIIRWKKYKKYSKNHLPFFLSRIIGFIRLYGEKSNLKQTKKPTIPYIVFDTTDNDYPTLKDVLPRKVLQMATKYSIQDVEFLELFCSSKDIHDYQNNYKNNWLYYASFSPIWNNRIREKNGKIDTEKKLVDFEDDDMDTFYDEFGYEPDEQSIETQNRNIGPLRPFSREKMKEFIDKYNKNGVVSFDEKIDGKIDETIWQKNNIF